MAATFKDGGEHLPRIAPSDRYLVGQGGLHPVLQRRLHPVAWLRQASPLEDFDQSYTLALNHHAYERAEKRNPWQHAAPGFGEKAYSPKPGCTGQPCFDCLRMARNDQRWHA